MEENKVIFFTLSCTPSKETLKSADFFFSDNSFSPPQILDVCKNSYNAGTVLEVRRHKSTVCRVTERRPHVRVAGDVFLHKIQGCKLRCLQGPDRGRDVKARASAWVGRLGLADPQPEPKTWKSQTEKKL